MVLFNFSGGAAKNFFLYKDKNPLKNSSFLSATHLSKNANSFAEGTNPDNNLIPNDSSDGTNLEKNCRRYIIVGERRFSNYLWAFVIFLGSCGFLYTGISSYMGQNLHQNNSPNDISFLFKQDSLTDVLPFFPQGLLMSFYGSLGFLLTIYWCFLIFWNVGGGFNEFNKKDGFIRIFRWGYPGKNRKIDISYSIKDVEAIRVELKQGLNPQRTIYLLLKKGLKGKIEIPLTGIGQPLTLKEIEKQASELSNFLQVSLEGL